MQVVLGWWVPPAQHKQLKQQPKEDSRGSTPQLPASSLQVPPPAAAVQEDAAQQQQQERDEQTASHDEPEEQVPPNAPAPAAEQQEVAWQHSTVLHADDEQADAEQPAEDGTPASQQYEYEDHTQPQDVDMPHQPAEDEEQRYYEQQQQQQEEYEGYQGDAVESDGNGHADEAAGDEGAPEQQQDAGDADEEEDIYGSIGGQVCEQYSSAVPSTYRTSRL